jgi:D-alanine-D-alanine ligase
MNNSKKINVALLCGGKSREHEVSLLSARNVYDSLDKNKYNVTIVGIDKMGRWLSRIRELSHRKEWGYE